MTFLDLFAGIGGFRRGLERSGHTCVGHVEIDKYANRSYMAMYGLNYCPYGELSSNTCKMCKTEVMEHCDGTECRDKDGNGKNGCEGEWYAKDIKQITAGEIPRAEIWTLGFPCTDLSVAGRMEGIHGARSGLFFTVTGLLKSLPAEDKPTILVLENVKHLVHSEKGEAFTAVLFELWEAGYDCEWEVINSAAHGVPQHRERVYVVGHLRGTGAGKVLPLGGTNQTTVKKVIGGTQGNRVYRPDGLSVTLTANGGGMGGRTGLYLEPSRSEKRAVSLNRNSGIGKALETSHTLTASDGRGLNRNQNQTGIIENRQPCAAFIDLNEKAKLTVYARCIKAKQNAGIVNHKGETSGVFLCQGRPDCVRSVVNPKRKTVRQNGRRIKEPGEASFTLTCTDRIGVLLCCCEHWKEGMNRAEGESICPELESNFRCCRVRRLTPRECWRLQAFEDELFDRAKAAGMSDTQLYKQAGNSITVNIVYEIGLRLGGTADGI